MSQSPGEMYTIAIVMSLIPLAAVAVRFYSRIKYEQLLAVDDWLILPALICALGTNAAMIYVVAGGLGTHTLIEPDGSPDVTVSTQNYLKADFVTLLTQVVTFGCTKLSVLFFYNRIFRGRAFTISMWTLVAFVVIWSISNFFANLFECTPIGANWFQYGFDIDCIDEFPFYQGQAWSDVLLDLFILILPIPFVWKLQLSSRRKVAICAVFFIGALTILSSILRLVSQYTIQADLSSPSSADLTYAIAPTFYWPSIESALGILGACLMTLRPLVADIWVRLHNWRSFVSGAPSSAPSGSATADKRTGGFNGDAPSAPPIAKGGAKSGKRSNPWFSLSYAEKSDTQLVTESGLDDDGHLIRALDGEGKEATPAVAQSFEGV